MKHLLVALLWASMGAYGLWLQPRTWMLDVGAALLFLNAGMVIGGRLRA